MTYIFKLSRWLLPVLLLTPSLVSIGCKRRRSPTASTEKNITVTTPGGTTYLFYKHYELGSDPSTARIIVAECDGTDVTIRQPKLPNASQYLNNVQMAECGPKKIKPFTAAEFTALMVDTAKLPDLNFQDGDSRKLFTNFRNGNAAVLEAKTQELFALNERRTRLVTAIDVLKADRENHSPEDDRLEEVNRGIKAVNLERNPHLALNEVKRLINELAAVVMDSGVLIRVRADSFEQKKLYWYDLALNALHGVFQRPSSANGFSQPRPGSGGLSCELNLAPITPPADTTRNFRMLLDGKPLGRLDEDNEGMTYKVCIEAIAASKGGLVCVGAGISNQVIRIGDGMAIGRKDDGFFGEEFSKCNEAVQAATDELICVGQGSDDVKVFSAATNLPHSGPIKSLKECNAYRARLSSERIRKQ